MCIDCYDQYDAPRIYNDKVKKAVKLIGQIYDFHSAGGALHIVLDDWNLERHYIDYCEDYMNLEKEGIIPKKHKIQMDCIALLKQMTIDERASALALHNGIWERDTNA